MRGKLAKQLRAEALRLGTEDIFFIKDFGTRYLYTQGRPPFPVAQQTVCWNKLSSKGLYKRSKLISQGRYPSESDWVTDVPSKEKLW